MTPEEDARKRVIEYNEKSMNGQVAFLGYDQGGNFLGITIKSNIWRKDIIGEVPANAIDLTPLNE